MDGSDFKIIGEGIDPTVSPDGTRVVFALESCRIFRMDPDGTNLRQLTTRENEWAGVQAAGGALV